MDDLLGQGIVKLKTEFTQKYTGNSHVHEVIPKTSSKLFSIENSHLDMLHKFATDNPIYYNSYEMEVLDIPCIVYEGDINEYWLNSIKHDTSYAPFYPTWILSAYALAIRTKKLGIEQVVDIGSGDGRIAYCGALLGIRSHGLEIDENLVALQELISSKTKAKFDAQVCDATQFDYSSLNLSKPVFFIGGLPEVGEMLADGVIKKIMDISELRNNAIFVLTGTYSTRQYSRNTSHCGWGTLIDHYNLDVIQTITVPTRWTVDQPIDTPYVFTRTKNR